MIVKRSFIVALAAAILCVPAICAGEAAEKAGIAQAAAKISVTIETRAGARQFSVEVARTPEQQERGLMFRTDIPADGGMLFTPYPADGTGPREASFWMENTPSALDIIFIRPNRTIARIAANAEPYSEKTLKSGEPVGAVLEINAGKAAELGIKPGDKVSWIDPAQ